MKTKSLVTTVFVIFASCVSANAQEYPVPADRVPSGLLIEQLNGTLPGAAGGSTAPRGIRQLALDLIKAFEGWSADLYDDPAGYCTLGYGHLIAKKKCALIADLGLPDEFQPRLTDSKGNQLLAQDTRAARKAIQNLVKVELNDNQFGAITAFVFNIGVAHFSNSTMLTLLNKGDYDQSSKEMLRWTTANKKVLKGLVIRRNCEYELFNGRATRNSNGSFDIAKCTPAAGIADNGLSTIDIETGELN